MDENLRESNLSAPILIDPIAYARRENAGRPPAGVASCKLWLAMYRCTPCTMHAALESSH